MILIVEDDPHVARLIGLVLQRSGHTSEVVGDGDSAIERARSLRPALIFADLGIKGLSAEKARGCGADDYMGKPFEFDDLLRLVNKYANRSSS